MPDNQPDLSDTPEAIFNEQGPIKPSFMTDAIRALMLAHPRNKPDADGALQRHLEAGLINLAASNPPDPINVMLTVQALSAYQAACVSWRIGMNPPDPGADRIRHISAAATAARTFDTMLRPIERRQAKPISVPAGRCVSRIWPNEAILETRGNIADNLRRGEATTMSERPELLDTEPLAVQRQEVIAITKRKSSRPRSCGTTGTSRSLKTKH